MMTSQFPRSRVKIKIHHNHITKAKKGQGGGRKKSAFLEIKNARRFSASGLFCGGRI
jgi:hypothetical protein